MADSLGDRMKKNYENVTRLYLTKRTPVIVRCDAKAFHSFTKAKCFQRPFDAQIIGSMVRAAKAVAEDMQGFGLAYIQSDEASFLLTDYSNLETQGWFDYNMNKIVSISASIMTAEFNREIEYSKTNFDDNGKFTETMHARRFPNAHFDSRAFNVPREDVANAFLWRAKDWERNSLQMYARSFFSHKQLDNKNREDMHEMLHTKGKNWATDLSDVEKNGTFLVKTENGIKSRSDILPTYSDIAKVVEPLVYPLTTIGVKNEDN